MKNFEILKKVPYLILIIGLLFSIYISFNNHQEHKKLEKLRFDSTAQQTLLMIENRMNAYKQVLLGGAGLFYASNNVTRASWKEYVEIQKIDNTFPGIQGVGYIAVVRAKEKDAYIKTVKSDGFGNYNIKPEGAREIYTPIMYLEPFNDRNKRAFGYDLYTEKVRREALNKTIESGETTLSGKIRLLQENGIDEQAGFLMFVPIYKKGALLNTKDERTEAIQGFVYAPFRAKDLLTGVTGQKSGSIDVEIYDGNIATPNGLLYDIYPEFDHSKAKFTLQTKLTISGHDWILCFYAMPQFLEETDSNQYLALLAGGVLLSFALFGFAFILVKTKERAESIAKNMTIELNESLKEAKEFNNQLTHNKQQLEASDLLLKKLSKQIPGVLFTYQQFLDGRSCFPFASENIYDIYDVTPEEVKEDASMIFAKIHPDDILFITETIQESFKTLRSWQCEYRVISKNGKIKWVRGASNPEKQSDGSTVWYGYIYDITISKESENLIKQSEETYRGLINTMGHIVCIQELDGTFINYYKGLAPDIHGYEIEELIGKNPTFFMPPELNNIDYVIECIKATATGIPQRFEVLVRHKSGTIVPYEVTLAKGKYFNKDVIVGIIVDISEQKALTNNLQMMVEKETNSRLDKERLLIQQSKLATMGEMISNIAHQWRQPLNTLAMKVQDVPMALKFNELDEKYTKDFRDSSLYLIQYMSQTIEDFRNFFKPDKEKTVFSIKEYIYKSYDLAKDSLNASYIETKINLHNEELNVFGYPNEFAQVVLNILTNAKDALKSKEIAKKAINISAQKVDNIVKVTISDNAGGIPEDIINKVFDPYFTTKDQSQGTGLGLYMSKMIIEQNMSGKLTAYNSDEGAVFEIELTLN